MQVTEMCLVKLNLKSRQKKQQKKSKIVNKEAIGPVPNESSAPKTMTNVNNSNTSASGLSHQNILQYNPDSSYLSIVNPSLQYAQQMQSFQPFQQTPHQQMVQPPFCSTPNMVHPPPNSSPSMMSQRPVWVDELFTNMRHIETRLDKLDQIGILVSSMNMKVIQVEQETKSLSERLAAVEISTQYVSDQYEDQKTKCNELKSSVINIEKTINTQHSDVSSVGVIFTSTDSPLTAASYRCSRILQMQSIEHILTVYLPRKQRLSVQVNGGWSPYGKWSSWTSCTVPCDRSTKSRGRNRACSNPEPKYGGKQCVGSPNETVTLPCNAKACLVDGDFLRDNSQWSPWDTCNASCGGGFYSRYRNQTCENPDQNGVMNCSGSNTEWQKSTCNTQGCKASVLNYVIIPGTVFPLMVVIIVCVVVWKKKRNSDNDPGDNTYDYAEEEEDHFDKNVDDNDLYEEITVRC
ncbi:SEMA5 [Mytilus edulis]|uniref:SEMA5 n=1 Tax=Mytilus edulis TaxID=6550 RepID=A0A8S3RXY8_MYTED|nr:SEMA5 [Mytilus edulis]